MWLVPLSLSNSGNGLIKLKAIVRKCKAMQHHKTVALCRVVTELLRSGHDSVGDCHREYRFTNDGR